MSFWKRTPADQPDAAELAQLRAENIALSQQLEQSRAELQALVPELEWAREAARELVRWTAGFDFPDYERDFPDRGVGQGGSG